KDAGHPAPGDGGGYAAPAVSAARAARADRGRDAGVGLAAAPRLGAGGEKPGHGLLHRGAGRRGAGLARAVRGAGPARAVRAEGRARGRAGGTGDAGAVAGGDQTGAADQAPADEPEAGGAGRGARGRGGGGGRPGGGGGMGGVRGVVGRRRRLRWKNTDMASCNVVRWRRVGRLERWGWGGWWEGAGGSGGKTRTWPLATWCGGGASGGSNGKTRQRPYAYGAPAGRWSRGSGGRGG